MATVATLDLPTFIASVSSVALATSVSMDQVRALLRLGDDKDRASGDVKSLALDHVRELDGKIGLLNELRGTLSRPAASCDGGDRQECAIIEELDRNSLLQSLWRKSGGGNEAPHGILQSGDLLLFVSIGCATAGLVSTAIGQEPVPVRDVAHIHGVAFSPGSDGILLATHHGLYAVDPQGSATLLSATQDDFMGFTIVTDRDNLLVASGHPSAGGNFGFIASEDAGTTWTVISEGEGGPVDFHALASSPANPDVLYGLYRGIQASRDGGTTWELAGPAPNAAIDLAASAISEQTVFAATGTGIYRSEDRGKSWSLLGPALPVTMVEIGPDGSLYAFFAGVGLFAGDASGQTWTVLNENLAGREFLHLAVSASDPGHMVAVTHASEVLESRDGGKSWSPYGSS